jgi:hypothetical protein
VATFHHHFPLKNPTSALGWRPADIRKHIIRARFRHFRARFRHSKRSDRLRFACDDAKLWAHVGPGDEGESVLTIMLEGED